MAYSWLSDCTLTESGPETRGEEANVQELEERVKEGRRERQQERDAPSLLRRSHVHFVNGSFK